MKIVPLSSGGLSANAYLLVNGDKSLLIDAGMENPPVIGPYLKDNGLTLLAILLTHGHFDHIAGLRSLFPGCPVYIHPRDREALFSPRLNGSRSFGCPFAFEEGEIDPLPYPGDGKLLIPPFSRIEVIHTPFHTSGSVLLYFPKEGALFSGDTLFVDGIGRYDLPGSEPEKVLDSLLKILDLPDKAHIYPGHGPGGLLGEEKRNNPYLAKAKAAASTAANDVKENRQAREKRLVP